jgi:hypothetical protein
MVQFHVRARLRFEHHEQAGKQGVKAQAFRQYLIRPSNVQTAPYSIAIQLPPGTVR